MYSGRKVYSCMSCRSVAAAAPAVRGSGRGLAECGGTVPRRRRAAAELAGRARHLHHCHSAVLLPVNFPHTL